MKVILIVLFLLIPSLSYAQTPVIFRLGAPVAVQWDYATLDVQTGAITRYEVQIDSRPWVNTGLPPLAAKYQYALPSVALTIGLHKVLVRACNVAECGPETSGLVSIIPVVPGAPRNLQFVSPEQPVTVPEAIELVQAHARISRGRFLTNEQLLQLAGQFTGPLTVGNVLTFADGILGK